MSALLGRAADSRGPLAEIFQPWLESSERVVQSLGRETLACERRWHAHTMRIDQDGLAPLH